MTQQPDALGWATHHEPPMLFPTREEALTYCDEDEEPVELCDAARITALEAALRQAVKELEHCRVFVTTREKIKHPEGTELYDEAITAAKQALGDA